MMTSEQLSLCLKTTLNKTGIHLSEIIEPNTWKIIEPVLHQQLHNMLHTRLVAEERLDLEDLTYQERQELNRLRKPPRNYPKAAVVLAQLTNTEAGIVLLNYLHEQDTRIAESKKEKKVLQQQRKELVRTLTKLDEALTTTKNTLSSQFPLTS